MIKTRFPISIFLFARFVVGCGMSTMIASDFLVLPMRLTEAIIVYGREDKQRNLKIVRSKEFRPNFRAAEQNVGRIWPPQPKCSKVGKVHLHGSQVRCPGAGRCALHYPTPSYTLTLPCKPGCSRRILQAQALAQKWLKLESNVFIAHTARRFRRKN